MTRMRTVPCFNKTEPLSPSYLPVGTHGCPTCQRERTTLRPRYCQEHLACQAEAGQFQQTPCTLKDTSIPSLPELMPIPERRKAFLTLVHTVSSSKSYRLPDPRTWHQKQHCLSPRATLYTQESEHRAQAHRHHHGL